MIKTLKSRMVDSGEEPGSKDLREGDRARSDRIAQRAFALNTVNLGSTPSIPQGPRVQSQE